jgi:hypothetical protein
MTLDISFPLVAFAADVPASHPESLFSHVFHPLETHLKGVMPDVEVA